MAETQYLTGTRQFSDGCWWAYGIDHTWHHEDEKCWRTATFNAHQPSRAHLPQPTYPKTMYPVPSLANLNPTELYTGKISNVTFTAGSTIQLDPQFYINGEKLANVITTANTSGIVAQQFFLEGQELVPVSEECTPEEPPPITQLMKYHGRGWDMAMLDPTLTKDIEDGKVTVMIHRDNGDDVPMKIVKTDDGIRLIYEG